MGGGAIVAAAATARQNGLDRVLDAYRLEQATTPATARALMELGVEPNNWVDELREMGALKPGPTPDSWYLDEGAYIRNRNAVQHRSKRAVLIAMGTMLALAAIGLAVQWFNMRAL